MLSLNVILFLLLTVVGIEVLCEECAFIPGPVTVSNDTTVITVDCDHPAPVDATGDNKGMTIYLQNCVIVPIGLFFNVNTGLSTVTVVSKQTEVLLEGTFEGLLNIAELRLEGFENLHFLSTTVFRPLRNLKRLILMGFGAHALSYAKLGAALSELSGTPLRRIVMHEIHSAENAEKVVNLTALFRLQNVNIKELAFSNNVITGISGQFSNALPDLSHICIGTNAGYYAVIKVLLDAWLFLGSLTDMTVYAVPDTVGMLPCGETIPELDLSFLNITVALLRHRESRCYREVRFPLPRRLRRLTLHEIKLTTDWHEEYNPICFEYNNNVEYLDMAGSLLPTNSTQITGLVNLKYLDLQNTGMTFLPDDFLHYFPKLERIYLDHLSLMAWIKHVNSSFFGNCLTLKEIHMGNCMLTTIPFDTFTLLPSLETLNLSSNFLWAFDVSFSNSSNLTYLDLSNNALFTLSQDALNEMDRIAQLRLQAGEMLTVDLRKNRLSCLCNSTHLVRQLQNWAVNREANIPGFEMYTCRYVNGSMIVMSQIDVDQSVTRCSVLNEFKNGSDCPCDDDLRRRLELIRMSLHGYFCRTSNGKLVPMATHSLPDCLNMFITATFLAPVVVVCVLVLALVITLIFLYRYRNTPKVYRVIERLSMPSIVRRGIQYTMAQHRDDPSSFTHDVFLYIADSEQNVVQHLFNTEFCPNRRVRRHDDFIVGLKIETLLKNVQTCRWLMPVLTQNFVDNGECCDFIARAQSSRPHAIVPVVWAPFYTKKLSITILLDMAEPVTWPGDSASDVDKAEFWKTLLERTGNETGVHEDSSI